MDASLICSLRIGLFTYAFFFTIIFFQFYDACVHKCLEIKGQATGFQAQW